MSFFNKDNEKDNKNAINKGIQNSEDKKIKSEDDNGKGNFITRFFSKKQTEPKYDNANKNEAKQGKTTSTISMPGSIISEEEKKLQEIKLRVEQAKKVKALEDKLQREKQFLEALQKEEQRNSAKFKNQQKIRDIKNKEVKEKELRQRQIKIMEAANLRPKTEEDEMNISVEKNNTKDTNKSQGKYGFDPKSMLSGGFTNAQSFIGNAWESVFGGDDQEWIVVCPKTRISPGEVVPVVAGGIDILLVASKDAKKLFAIANSCPHLGTPLETGPIERRPIEKFEYGSDITPRASSSSETTSTATDPDGDGCEECIVCPLHQTAFALESGEVRGEWCPYPPVIGKIMGTVKPEAALSTFQVRTKGKNIEIRLNSSLKRIDNNN